MGWGLTRLRLGNDVATLHARNDSALLDGRRLLETVAVDAAQQLLAQVHVIKVVVHLMPGGLDDTLGVHAGGTILSYFTSIIPAKRESENGLICGVFKTLEGGGVVEIFQPLF